MSPDPSIWTPDAPPTGDPPVGAVRRAVMVQHWTDIVFCHWRYDPADVQ
ncbi:MAG: DUF2071 domain-containing protein, partial [Acidimicrobiia bacterium]|nr:DUF2071 domain-containing protein [Acidimicrobiia bacterium]